MTFEFNIIPTVEAASAIIDSSGSYTPADIIRVGVSLVVLVA